MSLLTILLYIVFVLAAIVLTVVILLQEGKGGGFGDALGTAGTQTFGVATKGIQTFTGIVAGVFLVSAFLIHYFNRLSGESSLVGGTPSAVEAPADGGGAGGGGE
ncbi:MAG: preprotein translocase subunit SecG [Planctomycetes bacterium]|nr:preprotein translocase subunit SecG [Planctomycetota bacterium]